MEKLQYPLNRVWFSRGFTSSHRGVDIGWFSDYGQNEPMYAPGDGKVVAAVDGYGNTYSSGVPTWGNYVKIYHGNNEQGKPVYTLQGHMLKGSVSKYVKVGQMVKRGQQIGNMNNSGYSNGSHDHSEVYVGGASTSYRVNPVDYLYIYPDQYIDPDTERRYGVKKTSGEPPFNISPVPRDESRSQISVDTDSLRGRIYPGTDSRVYGLVPKGIYNIYPQYGTPEKDGYTWYCINPDWNGIGDRVWIAYSPDWATLLPPKSTDDKDQIIAELRAENEKLKSENNVLNSKIAEIKKIVE